MRKPEWVKSLLRMVGIRPKVGRPKGKAGPGKTDGALRRNIAKQQRLEAVASRFKSGETLQEIANDYGLSRERVRQLLRKQGLTGIDGGRTIKSFLNHADKPKPKGDPFFRRYGMERAELGPEFADMSTCDPRHPKRAFCEQRRTAKYRGFEWSLSFKEWWTLWAESGKWAERGRSADKYVLTRVAGCGPFSVDNCVISTFSESSRQGIQKTIALGRNGWRGYETRK